MHCNLLWTVCHVLTFGCSIFAALQADAQNPGAASFSPPLLALPSNGWSLLQHMLPEIGSCFNDAPCGCMIKFGDAMSMFGSDAAAPTADPHKLLKLCKDFTLQSQKHHEGPELELTDASIESVLVHVAALGCSVLQARVDSQPAVAIEVEETAADGLSTLATLEKDENFTARAEELARVGSVVEAVFTSDAPAPRDVSRLLVLG